MNLRLTRSHVGVGTQHGVVQQREDVALWRRPAALGQLNDSVSRWDPLGLWVTRVTQGSGLGQARAMPQGHRARRAWEWLRMTLWFTQWKKTHGARLMRQLISDVYADTVTLLHGRCTKKARSCT